MRTTRRRIDCRYPHPVLPDDFDVLHMDDGFISVTRRGAIPNDVFFVDVSGADTNVAGIRSFGDVVVPSASQRPGKADAPRESPRWALSDCFRGLNLCMFMWGEKRTMAEVVSMAGDPDVLECDQTKIDMREGDVLSCVTADADGRIICFDHAGNEIRNWTFPKPANLHDMRNYYAFCGVLTADRTRFTTHCVWNIQYNAPVGPPYDRRMARFAGLDFAPTAADWISSDKPIMVRFDHYMPMVVVPE